MAAILIVDDDPDILDLLENRLIRDRHDVRRAENGREALELAARETPDLVLMDLCMPVLDGIDACRAMKASDQLAATPVILISQRSDDRDVVAGLDVGAHDYITKPFRWPIVAARVRSALRIRAAAATILRQNEELEQFAYLASHDLQEPLRKIRMFGELLARDLGGGLPEPAAEDLGFILDAASRAQDMIEGLLGLSRAGLQSPRRDEVALDECVDRALDALAVACEEAGAVVTRAPLPSVPGDPRLLTQLYQNLIGNALKFRPAGRSPRIELTVEPSSRGHVLGVRDDGIGIDPQHHDVVFAPFRRLHGRAQFDGSGIGLALCRKVVRRHGGEIWVEGSPGEGAHFRFELPDRQHLPAEPVA